MTAWALQEDFQQSASMEVELRPHDASHRGGTGLRGEEGYLPQPRDILRVEFYWALTLSNAPRHCHNCGTYFLLTAGYSTCYCNNVAPGKTERTCWKMEAHRKEPQGKDNRTPAHQEYDWAYNRPKSRKQRGKISLGEWNAAVTKAQALLGQSERAVRRSPAS